MTQLLRSLIDRSYSYREPGRNARAQILITLLGMTALISATHILLASARYLAGSDNISWFGIGVALSLLGFSLVALRLLQQGMITVVAASVALILFLLPGILLYRNGINARTVSVVPITLVYTGLLYRGRGAILTVTISWIGLFTVAYLQSEGQLPAPQLPFDDLVLDVIISGGMLIVVALLLGSFAWSLELALNRANRIATLTRATATTGHELSRILNLDELLTKATELIRDRFAVYHVQIFIRDETQPFVNLTASTGQAGQTLMAQGFRVALTADTVVGETITSGHERYIHNIKQTNYRHPEVLADTRTELALPLLVGNEVAGALDVHSARSDAFREEDIESMRILANQISQAINNARLFEAQQRGLLQNRRLFLESETNLREIERLNRQITGQAWREYILERPTEQLGVRLHGERAQTSPAHWTDPMRQAVARNRVVVQQDSGEQIFSVPISIRGEAIGAIEVRVEGERNPVEVQNILQAVTERLAFSLENARLFSQARLIAEREQQINQVTAQLQGLTSIEDVLNTAINALATALDADQGQIRLISGDAFKDHSGNGSTSPAPQTDGDQTGQDLSS